MKTQEQVRPVFERVLKRTLSAGGKEEYWSMSFDRYDWVPGLGLYGLAAAFPQASAKEQQAILAKLSDWFDAHPLPEALTVNSCVPALAASFMYQQTDGIKYFERCRQTADYLIKAAPRTPTGAFEHTVIEKHARFKNQIWADTLFMAVLFLAKWSALTGDAALSRLAVNQLNLHLQYLKQTNEGLFYHGYACDAHNWRSGAHWGRANAWIAVSMPEIFQYVQQNLPLEKANYLYQLKTFYDTLEPLQAPDGMFRTVLDHPETYEETSATAGIALGIFTAQQAGLIAADYTEMAEAALKAVLAHVAANGDVTDVSSGTPIMDSIEAYNRIDYQHPTLYGQGLTLALCANVLAQGGHLGNT